MARRQHALSGLAAGPGNRDLPPIPNERRRHVRVSGAGRRQLLRRQDDLLVLPELRGRRVAASAGTGFGVEPALRTAADRPARYVGRVRHRAVAPLTTVRIYVTI